MCGVLAALFPSELASSLWLSQARRDDEKQAAKAWRAELLSSSRATIGHLPIIMRGSIVRAQRGIYGSLGFK